VGRKSDRISRIANTLFSMQVSLSYLHLRKKKS